MAIAEMLKNRETKIKRIVAVYEDVSIFPPCGRSRELMSIIMDKNNKIVGIGNPIYNISIKELYFKTIKHLNSIAYEK